MEGRVDVVSAAVAVVEVVLDVEDDVPCFVSFLGGILPVCLLSFFFPSLFLLPRLSVSRSLEGITSLRRVCLVLVAVTVAVTVMVTVADEGDATQLEMWLMLMLSGPCKPING